MTDEPAADGGPVPGHSLFTGYLLHALKQAAIVGDPITGSDLAGRVHRLVRGHLGSRQIPGWAPFGLHKGGEMVIELATRLDEAPSDVSATTAAPTAKHTKSSLFPGRTRRRHWRYAAFVAAAMGAIGAAWQARDTSSPAEVPVEVQTASAPIDAAVDSAVIAQAEPAPLLAAAAAPVPRGPSGKAAPKKPTDGIAATPPVVSSHRCPSDMVPVPKGSFEMGSPSAEGSANEHPSHRVTIGDAYCIDRTEVSVRAYALCVESHDCTAAASATQPNPHSTEEREDARCNGSSSSRLDHPINCVTWEQAKTYCGWRGRSLPEEAQWEYAARGSSSSRYPSGNDAPRASQLGLLRDSTSSIVRVHTDISPFGVRDMASNVSEWTLDRYGRYTAKSRTNPTGPKQGSSRAYRGGNWQSPYPEGIRAAVREAAEPSYVAATIGFRCVYNIPKPRAGSR